MEEMETAIYVTGFVFGLFAGYLIGRRNVSVKHGDVEVQAPTTREALKVLHFVTIQRRSEK